MLKIILLSYTHGLMSSRRIAKACETNIHFMSVSGDVQLHYTFIAGFDMDITLRGIAVITSITESTFVIVRKTAGAESMKS
jgi:hypothetical protein